MRWASSAYFRLTTRPVDQALAGMPASGPQRDERRRQTLAGGYRLREGGGSPGVSLLGIGAVMPEVIAAAEELEGAGIGADVICLTSPDLVFRAVQCRRGLAEGSDAVLDELFPRELARPLVTVLDGHPHTLAFLAAVHGAPIACLGVTSFGQSGDVADLYRHFGIDSDTIVGAALDLLEEAR
jgi:pyruvate dehydrogenase E1 component